MAEPHPVPINIIVIIPSGMWGLPRFNVVKENKRGGLLQGCRQPNNYGSTEPVARFAHETDPNLKVPGYPRYAERQYPQIILPCVYTLPHAITRCAEHNAIYILNVSSFDMPVQCTDKAADLLYNLFVKPK